MKKSSDRYISALHWLSKPKVQILFFALLCLCSLILGWRQYLWLVQAGDNQLQNAQREMAIAVAEAMENIRSELESQVIQALESENRNTAVISRVETLAFNNGQPMDGQSSDLYGSLESRLNGGRAPSPRGRLHTIASGNDHLMVMSLVELSGNTQSSYQMHLIQLNRNAFVDDVVRPALESALDNYRFRIHWQNTPLTLDGATIDAPADLRWSLNQVGFRPLRQTDGQFEFILPRERQTENAATVTPDPLEVFGQIDEILRAFRTDAANPTHQTGLVLHVYANGGSLRSLIDRQIWLNTGFGWAVLILLLFTGGLLIMNSQRLKVQQQREQEFVATISHELRTPLTVIRSAADNLQSGMVTQPDSIIRYGDEITRQSQRLDRMIESTLYYSRLPSQTSLRMDSKPSDAFINEILAPLEKVANDRRVTLHKRISLESAWVCTDLTGLRLILENLIMNALIHGQPEKGSAQIWLSIEVNNRRIRIDVDDNGMGIPKSEQNRVFEPFVRGHHSEQQQRPGTGLGLNLVKRTTERLGGSLAMESPYVTPLETHQQGTRFKVELPNHVTGTEDTPT